MGREIRLLKAMSGFRFIGGKYLWPQQLQVHQSSHWDTFTAPLGDRLRRHLAYLGNFLVAA